MELEDAYGTIDAIGFGKGHLYDEITYGVKLSFVGDLQINEWQGNKKPQLMISDVQTKEWQLFDYRGKNQVQKWIHTLPQQNCTFIAFNQKTVEHFNQDLGNSDIHFITEQSVFNHHSSYVVLLDLPPSMELLEKYIQQAQPKRIYAVFYTPESKFFNGMPTREQFGWYYSFLKKRPGFNLSIHMERLSQHIGLNLEIIKFMTNVFFELGFVTIENGLTTVNINAPKRSLSEATSYKKRVKQIEIEQKLLYAPYLELKQWFNERMKEYLYS